MLVDDEATINASRVSFRDSVFGKCVQGKACGGEKLRFSYRKGPESVIYARYIPHIIATLILLS